MPSEQVLVIDDDAVSAKLMEAALTRQGFAVTVCDEPSDVLERLTHDVVAVVSDLERPGDQRAGLNLLAEVRQRDPFCARVLISGTIGRRSLTDAMRDSIVSKDVHAYLPKPCLDLGETVQGWVAIMADRRKSKR